VEWRSSEASGAVPKESGAAAAGEGGQATRIGRAPRRGVALPSSAPRAAISSRGGWPRLRG
ncbi:hypothetical protein DJ70_03410, partial [Halorubrum halodurans]